MTISLLQRRTAKTVSVIGMGASTGGIDALLEILSGLPANMPPIVIVQHTSNPDGASLVQLLNKAGAVEVVAAQDKCPLAAGRAYVACGLEHHVVVDAAQPVTIRKVATPPCSGHRPSVDTLFRSMSELGQEALGVLLTGMGRDGAEGLKQIRERGGLTIGQDESSAVVYGMPRVAMEIGAVTEQLPLARIAPRIQAVVESTQ